MVDFSKTLLEKIDRLLELQVGDVSRLEHIRKSILENKKLYNSDIQYVRTLEMKNSKDSFIVPANDSVHSDFFCWKCKEELEKSVKFCPNCGADQNKEESDFDTVLFRRKEREFNPLKVISKFHSYQILAVLGGLASLIPIFMALYQIERIFEIVEFYSSRDLSELQLVFLVIGAVSGIWCMLVMAIPFWIKKPKKVGKFLFFSSFGILFSSILVGIVGFPIILFAGIFALKKRRY